MIVLEGPDGGGKSTLAQLLSNTLGYTHLVSEGPEKYPGEIDERITRYFELYDGRRDIIFDRHPCISQLAYGLIHDQTRPSRLLVKKFYNRNPLLIYCRPDVENVTHTATGEWDTPEYLEKINGNYHKLVDWYDEWALLNANYIYRIGSWISPIEALIKGWRT